MLLSEIYATLTETPVQMNNLFRISELVTAFINKIITDTQDSMQIEHRTDAVGKNRYGYDEDVYVDVYVDEYMAMEPEMFRMLNGKHINKAGSGKRQRGELEIDTIGDILAQQGVDPSSFDQATYDAVKDVHVIMSDSTEWGACYFNTGQFESGQREIYLSGPSMIKNGRVGIKKMATMISHELTHALDDIQSNGKYSMNDGTEQTAHKSKAEYLRSQLEVNARFSQAMMELKRKSETVPNFKSIFNSELQRMLQKYQLTVPIITSQQRQQLMKRAVAFFAGPNN